MGGGSPRRVDAIVIGAGFSGLYALHRLRELGVRARVLEMAENVGGTWFFNRYPGARCDIESIEYSYSFSDEIQQEWVWTETMPCQPEVEAYLNFVADRLGLRSRHRVRHRGRGDGLRRGRRRLGGDDGGGRLVRCPVRRRGFRDSLGAASIPTSPGWTPSRERLCITSRWPKEGFDLGGKRVGVIGTGSTGVQLIPVVARQAEQLYVFQRSAPYTLPWGVRAFEPGELDESEGAIRRDPRRAAAAPGGGGEAERVLVDVRDDQEPAAEDRPPARTDFAPSRRTA